MTVTSSQMRLLSELHRHGPKYLRDVKRAYGEDLVEVLERKHQLRRYRLPDGDVLALGARARRQFGLNANYTKPSTRSLRQQVVRGQVIRALERRDYAFIEHRSPYVTVMRDIGGRRTLVAVNHTGYSSRTLRRLVGETLLRDILSGAGVIIVDPHPERLKNAAQDYKDFFKLESLERVTQPPPN